MISMRSFAASTLSIFALAVLTTLPAQAQNLVQNPTFDTFFADWNHTGSFIGVGGPGHTGNYTMLFVTPNPGDGVLTQVIPTTPGGQYTFSFWLGNAGTGDDHFSASFDGNEVLGLLNTSSEYEYTLFSYDVTATTSNTTIQFAGYDANGLFALDDISVVARGGATAPEPGSLALLGMATLPIVGIIRRRKA